MHSTVQNTIYSFFASAAYTSKVGLKAYPTNYQGDINLPEFVRFHIIGPNVVRGNYSTGKKYTGKLIVSFLVPAGQGDKRGYALCTSISHLLDNKTFPNKLSFSTGSVTNYGLDAVNKSLWRVDYTNNFLIFGD